MLAADYFDGKSSRRQRVTLSTGGGVLHIRGEFGQRSEPLSAVEVSEPQGDAPRTLRFAGGAFCEVRDRNGLVALLAAAGFDESAIVKVQGRWHLALSALAGVTVILAAAYLWALPWLAETLAPRIPPSVLRTLSDAALQGLDAHFLAPSKLPVQRQQEIAAKLVWLDSAVGPLPPHRLLFRAAPKLGPNAFALPSGDVVLFDELVKQTDDNEEILAVLAHELGHVKYHHGMRQLIQGSVVSFVAGVYFGDISSVVAGLGALALESRYSRAFEEEADAYAGRLLLRAGSSVEPLVRALRQIEEAHAKKTGAAVAEKRDGLLRSHPETEARIAALRALAARLRQ